MATEFNTLAKNAGLQGILDWNPDALGTTIYMVAYSSDVDGAYVAHATATYGTPSSGAMDITGNVTINIGAGNTITHLRIQKMNASAPTTTAYPIYKKDVSSMAFTYAGTITITSGEISLVDPA